MGEENILEKLKKLEGLVEEIAKESNLDKVELHRRAAEELEKRGYKIDNPTRMPYGRPNIIATKEKEGLVTEGLVIVIRDKKNPLVDQLRRYEIGEMKRIVKKKIILVLPVPDGEDFEVWGLKQLPPSKSSVKSRKLPAQNS